MNAITEFAADHQSARLIYFILPEFWRISGLWRNGCAKPLDASQRNFRWYTMTELANFLNSRKQVDWQVSTHGRLVSFRATHPQSLEHVTWHLPSARFAEPRILLGSAKVVRDQDAWRIVAGPGTMLQFETQDIGQSKGMTK